MLISSYQPDSSFISHSERGWFVNIYTVAFIDFVRAHYARKRRENYYVARTRVVVSGSWRHPLSVLINNRTHGAAACRPYM